jgi:hypothetical protein
MIFDSFLKQLRNTPEYDELMERKEQYAFKMTSREFCAMLWIHEMFDNKFTVKLIRQVIPQEFHNILTEIMRQRLSPKKLCIDWTKVLMSYNVCLFHNLTRADKDSEYRRYVRELFPLRFN